MNKENDWFELIELNDHLLCIREKLSEVDPRFLTEYTNFFLLIGSHTALLIDTGCGLFSIRTIIEPYIRNKKLLVINTHGHWDHVGGNYEFEKVHIHEQEVNLISKPLNLTILKDSSKKIVNSLHDVSFFIPPAPIVEPLKDNDQFNLGDLNIKIIHTPGHSNGSICILTNKGELFTGDTAHFGAIFLPKRKNLSRNISSLQKLIDLQNNAGLTAIYPSHEQLPTDLSLLVDLYNGISHIEDLWENKVKNSFLHSWVIDGGKFQYVVSKI